MPEIFDVNYVRIPTSFFVVGFMRQETAALARAYLGIGSGTGDVTHTGALTLNQIVVGNGTDDIKVLASPADAAKFLNGAATPAFAAVKDSDLSTSDITTNNATAVKHGFLPKLSNVVTEFLDGTGAFSVPPGSAGTVTNTGTLTDHGVIVGNGGVDVSATAAGTTNTLLHGNTGADPTFSAVVEADITLANNTTNNVTTAKHGFAPILPNDATKYLDGTGAYTVPTGSGSGSVTNTGALTDHALIVGNGGVDVSALGSLGTTTTLLHGNAGGDPTFGAVVEADLGLSDVTTANASTGQHGFLPKLPNDATQYMDGTGNWSVPAGGGGSDPWFTWVEAALIAGGGTTSVPEGCTRVEVGTASAVAADANNLAAVGLATTASVNNDSYHSSSNTTGGQWLVGHLTQWEAWFRPVDSADVRYFCGVSNLAPATQAASNLPTGNYAMFRFSSTASNANWWACVGDGSSTEEFDTTIAVSTSNMVKLAIRWDGTAGNSFDFYINDSLVAQGTLDPAGTVLFHFICQQRTLANAAKAMRVAAQKIRTHL